MDVTSWSRTRASPLLEPIEILMMSGYSNRQRSQRAVGNLISELWYRRDKKYLFKYTKYDLCYYLKNCADVIISFF